MKKLVAAAVVAILATGCAGNGAKSVSYDKLVAQGGELYSKSDSKAYEPSSVGSIEIARTAVNTAFLAAKPAYEEYTKQLKNDTALSTYFAAVEAQETEEEKRAVYDALSDETRKVVDDYNNSAMGKKVMAGLAEAAVLAMKNTSAFEKLDTAELLKNIDFSQIMSEKSKLSLTKDQVEYLNDTVISAYNNMKVVSTFSKAV